jgi:hypothetical protein
MKKGGGYNFEGIEEVSTNSVARIGAREPKGVDTAEIRKLSDLLEVSRTLSSTLNLKAALARVLGRCITATKRARAVTRCSARSPLGARQAAVLPWIRDRHGPDHRGRATHLPSLQLAAQADGLRRSRSQ